MNKYHNSKIYTIRSHQTDKFYIGSTIDKYLSKRFSNHKNNNKNNNGTSSYEILQFDDAYIELLENFKCESREELNKREGELIRQYKDQCVNKNIAGRTQKERDELKKIIIQCPNCDEKITKGSLSRHNKNKHNNVI